MAEPLAVYDSARRPHPFLEEILELWQFRELVVQWTQRNLKLRYKRSAIGVLWTLLEPLLMMSILTLVFSNIFRFGVRNYAIYVLSGLAVFTFFRRSTSQVIGDMVATRSLAGRIHFPRSCFATSAVLTALVHLIVSILLVLAIMLLLGHGFTWSLLSLPLTILPVALFALGVGLVVATLGAVFYDVQLTYEVMLTAWFYATPIIYPVEILPDHLQALMWLNPLWHLCELVRQPIFHGQMASAEHWWIALLGGSLMAITGWWVFTRWRNVFDSLG